jgi:desampylase
MWGMALRLSREHHKQLHAWAEIEHPLECCGLLMGYNDSVATILLTRNMAQQPEIQFEIDPSQLILAERRAREGGLPVLGYFHSHPNGSAILSIEDAVSAAADGRYWLVVAGGNMTCWQSVPNGDVHGRFTRAKLTIIDESET